MQVERKSVKTANQFEALDMQEMVDSESDEEEEEDLEDIDFDVFKEVKQIREARLVKDLECVTCGGGSGNHKEFAQQIEFKQKVGKKVRFEKNGKS